MLLNYLKIAWRNLLKYRFFSFLNITGLSIGIACFLLIALFVTYELSYDRFHANADRIYRINSDIVFGGTSLVMAVSPDPMGAALKKDYPELEQFTRIYTSNGSKLIRKGTSFLTENEAGHADSTFFEVFKYNAVEGDLRKALAEPNAVVISASAARKYFGTVHALGKFLETDDKGKTLYKVNAVIEDMPKNGHFYFDFLFSMQNVDYPFGTYLSHNFATYLLLKKGTDPKSFEKHFPDYINRYVLPEVQQGMKIKDIAEFEKSGNRIAYSLIPITNIHLHSNRMAEIGVNGNSQYVTIFSAVAIFILLIACVNFMNLSTARSASRSREVGIRKVMGSNRSSLIRQFLAESGLVTLISVAIALVLTWLSLPAFNQLSGKSLSINELLTPGFLVFIVLLPVIIGLLAGLYPAFYLSSFNPISVLKSKLNAGSSKSKLRSALVVFQFTTSIILIVGTIVVYRQLNFIQHKKIGFNKDQVLVINGSGALNDQYRAFTQRLDQLSGVTASTAASYLPVTPSSRSDQTFATTPVIDTRNAFNMQRWRIDENYIPVMGMELIQGRNFSKIFGTDSSAIIINETAAGLIGKKDAIGVKIYTFDNANGRGAIEHTVVGVVKNFHFASLREEIGPLAFMLGKANWNTALRVQAAQIPALIPQIEKIWSQMAPGLPFSYAFLDESFGNMYQAEQRAGKVALSFSVLAILIACLGLFGLASYMAEQRTKEIGVRKVLGATVNNIVSMLSKDFLLLVLVAAFIGIPIAWFCMYRWLQDFAYRSSLPFWIFLLAAAFALFIALATVSFQAIRAALSNPVKSLRSE